jgi:DNA-binding GntR family transcriptional regulator
MQEHKAILKAYEAGDGAAARKAVTAHFEGGCRRMRSIMKPDRS